ncbi:KIAA0930-like isoform B [Senna tora]|uniref:KIAA0930-like isoform B n=1 Tax=Senna tora TaxID=362788 RepID=A0A834U161_9FABA|nr:KIAA0930-like isoform B [Senna tora]
MFGGDGETPSRRELLSMVKKHSNLLGKTIVEESDAPDVEMDMRFWHDVFDLYFVRGKESRGRQDDDLVFFVRKMGPQGYGSNNNAEGDAPYFVRRWAPKLDNLIDETSIEVDWRRSFYLNLIAHTSFSVTVAICSHQVLQNHQASQSTPLSPIYKVVKTVYASPSRVNFQLDSKKEVETTPAYPDICFAIDDFDSTFDTVVLTEKDHCYCVVLNAHDGAAFPSEQSHDCSISDNSSLNVDSNSPKRKDTKLTLFSGFVSYQMVRDAYDAGKSRFGSLLSGGHSPGKTDRIYMKGPGGRGEVEVAVSGVVDQSQEDSGPFSPVISKKGFGIGLIVRRAASVASVAAKHAYAAASASSSNFDDEMIPLKCSLMSISLPWEHIAYDLLFKGAPPVNM